MKVYLDLVFLENYILNFFIIYQITIFSKKKVKLKNVLVSSLIAALYSTILKAYESSFLSNILLKLLVINLVVYVVFKPKKLINFLKFLAYYYLIFFIYIGVIISITTFLNINIKNIFVRVSIYILGYVVTYVSYQRLWKMWKSNIKNDDLVYQIKFKINSKEINIKAFVDTGNSLKDIVNNLDIFIIQNTDNFNQSMVKDFEKTKVDLNTVNAKCSLDGYIAKNIQIFKNSERILNLKKAILVFVDNKLSSKSEYFSLISYDTYIEKLQGVSL